MITTVAIIGAGPAGMAAALQLRRYEIDFLLFDNTDQRSLLLNAWNIENYLGFYPRLSGTKLLQRFILHLAKNDIIPILDQVELLEYRSKNKLFTIKTCSGVYKASYVIVASGTKPKTLVEIIPAEVSKRVFYEVFPLLKKRGKTIVIIGGGDAAFDSALNLAKYNQVIICNREKNSSALPDLINKTRKNRNISYFQDHKLINIQWNKSKKKIIITFRHHAKYVSMEGDTFLIAIGRLPQKDFYHPKLKILENKLCKNNKLFLAGDVKGEIYRQISTATGDGIKTAMLIFYNLKEGSRTKSKN